MEKDILRRCTPRALALLSCALVCVACGGHSSTGDATTGDAGTLILQAFGGPSGEVAAQVPLVEPGVGQQETCSGPLDTGLR
jgi:ABC-type glycerol-3-phosphate transport system substrate-binding protein